MSGLAERYAAVQARVADACDRAGRPRESVSLVAVSKVHPASAIREVYALGQRAFGENYVQELSQKVDALGDLEGLKWHFIGHLQRNKAKHVTRARAMVETVDSPRLAAALAKRIEGEPLEVLAQVNVGDEEQKAGCAIEDLPALLDAIGGHPTLSLRGLMAIPPWSDDPETTRPYFARVRALAERHGLAQVSMGMSADLEVAIEEGATIVRVGTAIFGPRPST